MPLHTWPMMSGAKVQLVDPASIRVPSDDEEDHVSTCSQETVAVESIGPNSTAGLGPIATSMLNTEQLQDRLVEQVPGPNPDAGQMPSAGPEMEAGGVVPIPKANLMARPKLGQDSSTVPLASGPISSAAAAPLEPRPCSTAPDLGQENLWANWRPTQATPVLPKTFSGPMVIPPRPKAAAAKADMGGPTQTAGPNDARPKVQTFGPKAKTFGPRTGGPAFAVPTRPGPKAFGQLGVPQHMSSGQCMLIPGCIHRPGGYKFVVGDIPVGTTPAQVGQANVTSSDHVGQWGFFP